jgi:hypothetical protein
MSNIYADMRRAGYDIGTSKAELVRLMLRALLVIEPGTPDLKDAVLARLGRDGQMAKARDIQAAWQTAKRRAAKDYLDRFVLEGKILRWKPAGE